MVIEGLINIVVYIQNISFISLFFITTYATMVELNNLDRLCDPHEQNYLIVSSIHKYIRFADCCPTPYCGKSS